MTITSYVYTKEVDRNQLTNNIMASAITIALHDVTVALDQIEVFFKTALSAAEKLILDDVIVATTADPVEELAGTTDADGDINVRIKEAKKGWHVQPHYINFVTSKIGQVIGECGKDLAQLDWSAVKYYKKDANDDLVLTTDVLDTEDVVATVIEFAPPFDYEIKSGEVKVLKTPTNYCMLFPIGVPDIPAPAGNKPFATGGIDLRFIENGAIEKIESAASKFMPYSYPGLPDGLTNKIQLWIAHAKGINVDVQFKFGILAE